MNAVNESGDLTRQELQAQEQAIYEDYVADQAARWAEEEYWQANPNRLIGIDYLMGYEPEPMLIEGYLPRKGFGQLYGKSYSGKSYAAVDLALSVCAGLGEWMGLPLDLNGPQHVIYVAAEGGMPFRDAVVAWLAAHPGADLSGLHVLDGGKGHVLQISIPEQEEDIPYGARFDRLIREVNVMCGEDDIAMIVMDPQINILSGVDENSNREMASVMARLKQVADASQTLMLSVHHTGHDGSRGRGASAQFGMMDLVIRLEGSDGQGAITFEKVKGAARPKDHLPFVIESVDIDAGTRQGAVMRLANSGAYLTSGDQADLLEATRKRMLRKGINEGTYSAQALASVTKIDRNTISKLLTKMEGAGEIRNDGSLTRPRWTVVEEPA